MSEENENIEKENNITEKSILSMLTSGEAFKEATPELIATFLPKARFLFPLIETRISKFMEDNNCIIIVKKEKNGTVSANVFDKSKIVIGTRVKDSTTGEKYQLSEIIRLNDKNEPMIYSLAQIKKLLEGDNIEQVLKSLDMSSLFE